MTKVLISCKFELIIYYIDLDMGQTPRGVGLAKSRLNPFSLTKGIKMGKGKFGSCIICGASDSTIVAGICHACRTAGKTVKKDFKQENKAIKEAPRKKTPPISTRAFKGKK